MQVLTAILLGLLLLGSNSAWATAQMPDLIIIEGQEHHLYSNPLEKYFGPDNPRPKFRRWHTANWRGYVATWEIDGGVLYLKALRAKLPTGEMVGLEYLFPEHKGRVEATWFTGKLRVPQGKRLQYRHMGYQSVFERDLIITIEAGKVVDQQVLHNRPEEPQKKQ